MITYIDLSSLFHAPSLAHKVTPQQAAGNCKLNKFKKYIPSRQWPNAIDAFLKALSPKLSFLYSK
jgi:hypothetical protein